MKSLSAKTFQCGVTVQGLTTLSGTVYLTALTNTATWDYVVVGTTAQGQLYTRTYAQLMSDITSGIGLSGYVPTSRTLTINGVSYDLTANRSWTISTVDYTSRLQHQVKAGVAINKGQAVYVTSADGTNMIVGLASNASEATSSKTMGLLDATVSTNGFANVVTEGLLAGLDTSTAGAAGDPVWLGTGGNLIYGLINKPYAPAHLVFIGIVTRKNNSNGEIFVKVQNGFELKEIHDVDLFTTTPVNGHILGFDGTLWVNKTVAGWLGYTPANASGTTNYISKFTGSTTLGNSLVFDNGTNVGIGTVTPDSRLHIEGNTTGSGSGADAIVHIKQNGGWNGNEPWALYVEGYSYLNGFRVNAYDTQRGLYSDAGELGFAVGGNSPISFTQNTSDYRMYIAPGGNIGIGTITPTTKLHVVGTVTATAIQLNTGSGDYYINGSSNTLRIGSLSTSNKIQLELFHAANPVSLGISYNGGQALPYIESVHPSYDVNTHLLFKPGGGENWRIGSHGSDHIYGSAFAIKPASNNYDFYLANSSGTALFYSDTSTGNIGIGTTSPAAKLDVYGGDIYINYNQYLGGGTAYNSVWNRILMYNGSTGDMEITMHNTNWYLRHNANASFAGNVGIGTTSPLSPLHQVGGGGNYTGEARFGGSSTAFGIELKYTQAGSTLGSIYTSPTYSSTDILFKLGAGSGNENQLVLKGNGNVGIGTTTPSARLHISGSTDATQRIIVDGSGNNSSLHFNYNGSNVGFINSYQNSELNIGTSVSAFVNFYTNNTERIRIAASGNVGIGTTNPVYTLDVNGSFNALTSGVYLTYNSGIIYHGSSYYQFPSGSYYLLYGRTGMGLIFGSNNAEVGRFDLSGNLGIGTTAPAQKLDVIGKGVFGSLTSSRGSYSNGLSLQNNTGEATSLFLWQSGVASAHIGSPANSTSLHIVNSYNTGLITDPNAIVLTNTGNVGIGTTSPSAKFVVSDGGAAGIELQPEQTTDTNRILNYDRATATYMNLRIDANTHQFMLSGTEKMRITNDGNVGIGTTSPNSYAGYTTLTLDHPSSGGIIDLEKAGTRIGSLNVNDGNFNIVNPIASDMLLFTAFQERLRITSTGNVGIGTSTPAAALHTIGTGIVNIVQSNNGVSYTQYYNTSTSNGGTNDGLTVGNNGLTAYVWQRESADLLLGTSNTEAIRITSTQNVGIGTTSPSEKLDVYGAIKLSGQVANVVTNGIAHHTNGYVYFTGGTAGAAMGNDSYSSAIYAVDNGSLELYAGSANRLHITSGGNVGIGTTSPGQKLHVSAGNFLISGTAIGSGADANSGLRIVAPISTTHYNWMLGAQQNINSAFEITPSTTVGGTTFSTPTAVFLQNGNVGIGTTAPTNRLQIGSIGSSGYGGNDLAIGNGTQVMAFYQSATVSTWYTNTSFSLMPSGSGSVGNVGIGTLTPSTLLDVSGVITATGGNSTNWNTAYGWGNHSSAGYVPQARTLTINGTSYDLSANRSWTIATTTPGGADTQFQYNSSGSLAGASALTYNSTTNRVGINQASPGYDFDVNGQVRVQDKLRVGTVNSGNGVVHMSSSATINPSATTIVWAQNVSVGMCAFIEYYILNNNSLTDQRAGTIMVTWNQSGTPTIAHTETTTPDIGSTIAVNFTSSLVGSDARINAVNSSANPYTMVMSYKYF